MITSLMASERDDDGKDDVEWCQRGTTMEISAAKLLLLSATSTTTTSTTYSKQPLRGYLLASKEVTFLIYFNHKTCTLL